MDVADSELVTRLVNNEYFQHQVRRHAEEHAQTLVAARARLAGGVLTALVTVLGAFGLTQYYSAAALSARVAEVTGKAQALEVKLQQVDRLLKDTDEAAGRLRNAAQANIDASQRIISGAAEAARQTTTLADSTREYTSGLLADVRRTQSSIDARNDELRESLAQARNTLKDLGDVPTIKNDISSAAVAVEAKRAEVEQTSSDMKLRLQALEQSVHFEREIAKAKTFEVVLSRRGSSNATDIELPDFNNIDAKTKQTYRMHIVVDGASGAARFRITVNDANTQVFDLKKGEQADVAATPFRVRVDSIYHAKLAYDFVVLRILPKDDKGDTRPAPGLTVATGPR